MLGNDVGERDEENHDEYSNEGDPADSDDEGTGDPNDGYWKGGGKK